MAIAFADRVRETSTTTGTGTLNLDGAVTSFQGFVIGVGTLSDVHYAITDGADWEVGEGVVIDASPDTLSRVIVHDSSNSGALVNFAAGTKDVFLTMPAGHSSAIQGKNFIIGGAFETNPWQRGTAFTAVANGDYTADRFRWSEAGAGVIDIDRVEDAPSVAQVGFRASKCLSVDVTTLDATIAAGDHYVLSTRMEGYDWAQIAQNDFVVSFWHKHTKTGTYCLALTNSGSDRTFVAEYTQSVTDVWEKATIKVIASPSAGTWDYTTGVGIRFRFTVATGSTFHTTAGAWNTGNFFATSNQVNAMDSTSNFCRFAFIQVEKGKVATDFERRSVAEEIALCQRYYQTYPNSFDLVDSASSAGANIKMYPVLFRADPTIVQTTSSGTGASWISSVRTLKQSGVHSVNAATSVLTLDAEL